VFMWRRTMPKLHGRSAQSNVLLELPSRDMMRRCMTLSGVSDVWSRLNGKSRCSRKRSGCPTGSPSETMTCVQLSN
jgi:hypothetical protein